MPRNQCAATITKRHVQRPEIGEDRAQPGPAMGVVQLCPQDQAARVDHPQDEGRGESRVPGPPGSPGGVGPQRAGRQASGRSRASPVRPPPATTGPTTDSACRRYIDAGAGHQQQARAGRARRPARGCKRSAVHRPSWLRWGPTGRSPAATAASRTASGISRVQPAAGGMFCSVLVHGLIPPPRNPSTPCRPP